MKRTTGTYETTTAGGEAVSAFVPFPLPVDPPLAIDPPLGDRLADAEAALERLELIAGTIPSFEWFTYAFLRKEAVLSSQIEGTQATLVDLLTADAIPVTEPHLEADLEEVCNVLEAIAYVRGQIRRDRGLPISIRLLNGAHRRLMKGTRGSTRLPGALRRSQNRIGGDRPGTAHFVPPPPHRLADCLTALERYIHGDDPGVPPLLRVGLCHVQFETIHPYLDGNGRLGRLLIVVLLEHWRLLSSPLLHLSVYFRKNRETYYRRLDAVRSNGDWEGWSAFYLDGVKAMADDATRTAQRLAKLVAADRARLLAASAGSIMAVRLLDLAPLHPVLTIRRAAELLDVSRPTAAKAIRVLVETGVLHEATGRLRDRVFNYRAYLRGLQD